MKKLLLFLLFIISNAAVLSAQTLDYENPFNNEMYFPDHTKVSKENLTKYFEDILREQGNATTIKSFKLLKETDEALRTEYIMIVGYNSDNSIKIAARMAPYVEGLYLATGTVTCKGCTRGCNPKKFGSDWECTDCGYGSGGSGCEKTVTQSTNP